ncbi:MAG: hypothetical protein M1443_02045 [Nitrospirae bacterium]|nr:hypothetical protein [Nitrospirota bacterium]
MKNTEIWLFIFILGLLGLNWPLLEIFRIEVVTYLFVFWALFIILVAFATFRSEDKKGPLPLA